MKSFNQYLESREINILIENMSYDLEEMNLDVDEFIEMYLEGGFLSGLGNFVKGAWEAGKAGYRQVRDDPGPAIQSAQKSLTNLAQVMQNMNIPNLSGQLSHMANFIGGLKNQIQWQANADPNQSQYQVGQGMQKTNLRNVMNQYQAQQNPYMAQQRKVDVGTSKIRAAKEKARADAASYAYPPTASAPPPSVAGQPTPNWDIPGVTPKP